MMVFFLLFLVILAVVLQRFMTERSLDTVAGEHWPSKRVVEQEEQFEIIVALKNSGKRSVPFIRVRESLDGAFIVKNKKRNDRENSLVFQTVAFTTWLKPKQMLTKHIPVHVEKRGRYVFNDLTIYGGDFLGIKEQLKRCGRFNEVVVAPREIKTDRVVEMFGGFMGDVSVNRFILEDPVLTLGYREYTGREPMKMISWAQSARGSGLMVKRYDYTLEPSVSVVLNIDTDLPDSGELLEKCFSLARTVCSMLEKRGVKYDFMSNAALAGVTQETGYAAEGLGTRHFTGVLEHLGRATHIPHTPANRMLEREARRPASSAGRILITPGDDPRLNRHIARLREAANGNLLIIKATEVAEC